MDPRHGGRNETCAANRATFDTDNIDIGPERRNYLDHRLSRVWEMNSEVGASAIATVPCKDATISCNDFYHSTNLTHAAVLQQVEMPS